MIYETFDVQTLREIDDLIGEVYDFDILELNETDFDFSDYMGADYDY